MFQFGALKGEEAIAWFDTLAWSGPDLTQEQMATLLGDWKLILHLQAADLHQITTLGTQKCDIDNETMAPHATISAFWHTSLTSHEKAVLRCSADNWAHGLPSESW